VIDFVLDLFGTLDDAMQSRRRRLFVPLWLGFVCGLVLAGVAAWHGRMPLAWLTLFGMTALGAVAGWAWHRAHAVRVPPTVPAPDLEPGRSRHEDGPPVV
jgi:hypothetical protein